MIKAGWPMKRCPDEQSAASGKALVQKWDYKYIDTIFAGIAVGWKWTEDGKPLPGTPDIIAKAKELGHQGWELVSVYYDGVQLTRHWFKRPVPEGVPPPLPKA